MQSMRLQMHIRLATSLELIERFYRHRLSRIVNAPGGGAVSYCLNLSIRLPNYRMQTAGSLRRSANKNLGGLPLVRLLKYEELHLNFTRKTIRR